MCLCVCVLHTLTLLLSPVFLHSCSGPPCLSALAPRKHQVRSCAQSRKDCIHLSTPSSFRTGLPLFLTSNGTHGVCVCSCIYAHVFSQTQPPSHSLTLSLPLPYLSTLSPLLFALSCVFSSLSSLSDPYANAKAVRVRTRAMIWSVSRAH